jgi:hypothetical protein
VKFPIIINYPRILVSSYLKHKNVLNVLVCVESYVKKVQRKKRIVNVYK